MTLAFGSKDVPPLMRSVSRVHSARFAAAVERYRNEFDRGLSLTDWTSVVVAEDEGCDEIATFDAGFRSLLRVVDR